MTDGSSVEAYGTPSREEAQMMGNASDAISLPEQSPQGAVLESVFEADDYADQGEGEEESNQMPTNAAFRETVLSIFSGGQELTNSEVISRVRDSGLLSESALQVMTNGKPVYEARVELAIWKLWKTYKYLDRLDEKWMRINDAGREECVRLGIIKNLYGKKEFLKDVYMSEDNYRRLRGILLSRKNLILQGAPGVGKTYCARRLAWSIMGEQDNDRIEMIQFHQSYGYEDFIMGYKPDNEGFVLKEGVFLRFCRKAAADPKRPYFFIIDEINRGNLSKIFGEVMMLIENEYRGQELRLAYHDESFSIPANLYLIGMMNTADRGLALIDYALRRRFAFFDMRPGFDTARFKEYQEALANEKFNLLVDQLRLLNSAIREDPSLGKGFEIGHSRLCGLDSVDDEWLRGVIEYDIVPTLEEYWFDDSGKVESWRSALLGVLA